MLIDKLNSLKADFIAYASLVEIMISKSISGLLKRDIGLLKEVINADEERSNKYEVDLDEQCTTFIAQFEPKAKELRTILMILKMNNDLERLGDKAVNMSESALFLAERPQIEIANDLINSIKEEALLMFKDSITAFIDEDTALAKKVCAHEPNVNSLRDRIVVDSINFMKSHPAAVEQCFHIIRIARSLERIADLSTNICEDIIYLVDGKVIKHRHDTP